MSTLDWLLFAIPTIGLLLSGWIVRKYMRSVADFIVLNRRMRMFLGLSTWSVEGIGLVSIVYLTEQGFNSGFALLWMMLLNSLLYLPVFGILGFGIQRFRATRVQTIPQFHEMRFSKGVRITSGIALAVGGILNMAIFPAVSSRFLVLFMGLPKTVHVSGIAVGVEEATMLLLVCISVFMATLGGMVTMVVTDYIQYVLLTASMFIIVSLSVVAVGPGEIDRVLTARLGASAFNPFVVSSEGDGFGVTWVLFFVLSGLLAPLSFPPSTSKLSATVSPETTRRLAFLGNVLNLGRNMMLLVWGVCALTYAMPSATSAPLDASEARFATASFLHSITPAGMLGICACGMVCAYISTDSGYYLSWSAIIINDIVTPLRGKSLSQNAHLRLLRCAIFGIAAFLLTWSFTYKTQESILEYIYLTGTVFTSAGIITFFGLYWRRATSVGAYLTAFICLALPLADIFGKWWFSYYPLKGHQSGLLAIVLSILAFLVSGLLSRAGEAKWKDFGEQLRLETRPQHSDEQGTGG